MASGPRVKLASCKSALNPPVVYSTDRSKAVVPVLVLLFVALWFILRGDLLYVLPCVILFLCFSALLVLRLLRLGKRELILVLFVRLFDLCLFGFVGFLFLLVSGKGCGLWLWTCLLPFFMQWSNCYILEGCFDTKGMLTTNLMAKTAQRSARWKHSTKLVRYHKTSMMADDRLVSGYLVNLRH